MHYLTGHEEGETRTHKVFFQLIAAVLSAGLLFSCGSGSSSTTTPTATVAGELVASTPAGSLDAAGLTAAVERLGLAGVVVNSGATCYKLTYGTPDVSDNIINASGLVCLSSAGTGSRPVISYQHGTIFQDRDAPSSFITSAEAALGAVFAGLGYIAVLPDYIGYGDSTAILHPYLHASTLASATVNMNRAARTFLANINVTTNGQFFLTGYSEGGYATLATQRFMEQSLPVEFPVTASEPGAGPYDMSTTTLAILSSPTLSQPGFAGFFFKAYDTIYNTPSQLTRYFSTTFATVVDTHFDGSFTRSQITAALGGGGVQTTTLFNPAFLTSYLGTVTGEAALKAHIAENDIYDWAPQVPTRLFHSVDDDTVPYANTTKAKEVMDLRSAPSVTVVNCITIGVPADHTNCARPFAADMIIFFNSLATGL